MAVDDALLPVVERFRQRGDVTMTPRNKTLWVVGVVGLAVCGYLLFLGIVSIVN
jgi:hypothetical protein